MPDGLGWANKALQRLWRAARDPAYRRDLLWWKLPRPAGVFQLSGNTKENRFPEIFQCVSDGLGDCADLRILSFGCSTGEEVFTLRRYFPSAAIDGIDVNWYRIRECRRRLRRQGGDPRLRFFAAGSARHLPELFYDAIFCMAVLRHGDLKFGPPVRCDHLIEFAAFEAMVEDFARILKPGGFLAVAFSNFRFADTLAADAFDPIMQLGADSPDPTTPLYGCDNRLLPDAHYADVLFRKRQPAFATAADASDVGAPWGAAMHEPDR